MQGAASSCARVSLVNLVRWSRAIDFVAQAAMMPAAALNGSDESTRAIPRPAGACIARIELQSDAGAPRWRTAKSARACSDLSPVDTRMGAARSAWGQTAANARAKREAVRGTERANEVMVRQRPFRQRQMAGERFCSRPGAKRCAIPIVKGKRRNTLTDGAIVRRCSRASDRATRAVVTRLPPRSHMSGGYPGAIVGLVN